MNKLDAEKKKKVQASDLDRRVAKLRKKVALEAALEILNTSPNSVASHFSLYINSLPLPEGGGDIEFNNRVTELALDRYILPLTDPHDVLYLGSKLVEQSFYQIFRSSDPSEPIKNLSVSKHFGVFFTPKSLSVEMVEQLRGGGTAKKLLDPCAGAGVLLGEAMIQWRDLPYQAYAGIELDGNICWWANKILDRVADLVGFIGDVAVTQGDGLEELMNRSNESASDKRDIIINPPFGRLRVTRDRFTNKETKLEQIGSIAEGKFEKFIEENSIRIQELFVRFPNLKVHSGIPEYSKLFLHACALNAEAGSRVSFIGPDTWMSGRQTAQLRQKLISCRAVKRVLLVKEGEQSFSTVNQHMSIVFMPGFRSENLSISKLGEKDAFAEIPYVELEKKGTDFVGIPRLSGAPLSVYRKLDEFTKLKDLEWLDNARGEVDQTLQKELFKVDSTPTKLVRGTHVEPFRFVHMSTEGKPSFLDHERFSEFISGKPKEKSLLSERIVGRQCSYAQQKNRLIFCRVPASHAVGNSCNSIVVKNTTSIGYDRMSLVLGLISNSVTDWFFRVANGNNHVANYEIDNFPYPQNEKYLEAISVVVEQLEKLVPSESSKLIIRKKQILDAFCCLAFNLEVEDEIPIALAEHESAYVLEVQNLARQLQRGVSTEALLSEGGHFNHRNPKLSELDMKVIEAVPEGGNWQDIPDTIPGERLVQIRKMTEERGVVRTTYYGRLRRDHPSYTINTYFNRPGNGTHIHPTEDRTLTSREAARLQSFPDNYIFTGSQAAVRKQIGNAVPPLLAKAVGTRLLELTSGNCSVDLFCGAGGLSLGLEAAGWSSLCGVDNDLHALNTYALNRPSIFEPNKLSRNYTSVLQRDLLDEEQLENLYQSILHGLQGKKLDLLVGGPPCQGFSHAGYRNPSDRRNDLASIFIECAERLRPSLFVLENVEGLATMKKGQVLSDIVVTLEELGYKVASPVWRLQSEEYGVPQMRRRLFVVASLDHNHSLSPPTPSHNRCRGRREDRNGQIDWFDKTLLPYATVQDALSGISLPYPDFVNKALDDWLK